MSMFLLFIVSLLLGIYEGDSTLAVFIFFFFVMPGIAKRVKKLKNRLRESR